MGQVGAPFFVLRVDPATGRCGKHLADVERADEAVCACWSSRRKCLFAGSCYAGHLHRFDPRVGRLEDMGAINPKVEGAACFPCRMDEHPDGSLYIGSYGQCDLTRFNPDRGTFDNFGRMDPVDMYFYPLCGADGSIAGLVKMTHPHIVVIDHKTGQHRAVGPVADTDKREGFVELFKGTDGLLYVRSHEGNFRVKGMDLVPIAEPPVSMPAAPLADGSTFRFLDAPAFEYRQFEVTKVDGTRRVFRLDWEGDGTNLWFCHTGPDGKVYGSSMLPEHLFMYDPASPKMVDHGQCSTSGGEAYSMANMDGRIYIASYPAARLSVFDPSRPIRFGLDEGSNPRELGRVDDVAFRPRAMVAGPAGKVWVGSIPDYGMWGGTLAWYDPSANRFGSHRHIIKDCCPYSMAWLPGIDRLLVGLAVEGGTGTKPRAQRAGFCLWDPYRDAAEWTGDFGLNVNTVFDVIPVGEGMAYASVLENGDGKRPTLFYLDVKKRSIVSSCVLEDPPHGWVPEGTQTFFLHRGFIYGGTYRGVYRARIGTTAVEPYWQGQGVEGPPGGGALVGDSWYFPRGHRLRVLELPH